MSDLDWNDLAAAIAKTILAQWKVRTIEYQKTGFQIVINVHPGQTQARILWPQPQDDVKVKEKILSE